MRKTSETRFVPHSALFLSFSVKLYEQVNHKRVAEITQLSIIILVNVSSNGGVLNLHNIITYMGKIMEYLIRVPYSHGANLLSVPPF